MYEDLLSGVISIEDACQTESVVTVKEKIEKLEYHEESESCKPLACEYGNGGRLKKILKAERLGVWTLHLEALREMLPFLAASGHNLYTKSAGCTFRKC